MLVLAVCVSARAQNHTPTPPPCPAHPPAFPDSPWQEDNRYLANPDCHADPLDRAKFIRLRGDSDDAYLSFGADVRERGEYFDQPNWGAGPDGSAYLLQRYYMHADAHLGTRVRAFGEVMSSWEHGRIGGPRPNIDVDKLDIHEAFVDVHLLAPSGDNTVMLRAGRHEMQFGAGNLVSARDGRNNRRSFDGVRATAKLGEWTADVLAVKPGLKKPGVFDDGFDETNDFWGVYATGPIGAPPGAHLDLYYLGVLNRAGSYNRGTGREQRETLGGRLWGSRGRWDYTQEYTFQWGTFAADDIRAWAIATETGFRMPSASSRPRISTRADVFSGDGDRAGHTLGTFNALFQKGPYFSYAETFGNRNVIDLQPTIELTLPRGVTLKPNAAFFWRSRLQDGLYSTSGSPIVDGSKSTARYIGSQLAVQAKWATTRRTSVFAEYLHFFPGAFLSQSTPGRSLNYATWWIEFKL